MRRATLPACGLVVAVVVLGLVASGCGGSSPTGVELPAPASAVEVFAVSTRCDFESEDGGASSTVTGVVDQKGERGQLAVDFGTDPGMEIVWGADALFERLEGEAWTTSGFWWGDDPLFWVRAGLWPIDPTLVDPAHVLSAFGSADGPTDLGERNEGELRLDGYGFELTAREILNAPDLAATEDELEGVDPDAGLLDVSVWADSEGRARLVEWKIDSQDATSSVSEVSNCETTLSDFGLEFDDDLLAEASSESIHRIVNDSEGAVTVVRADWADDFHWWYVVAEIAPGEMIETRCAPLSTYEVLPGPSPVDEGARYPGDLPDQLVSACGMDSKQTRVE